jgi:hypothetical protein
VRLRAFERRIVIADVLAHVVVVAIAAALMIGGRP